MTEGGRRDDGGEQYPSPGSYAALSRLRRPRTPGAAIHPDHTLNNPEQIRTNLNKPERWQMLRPDREVARIAPEQPEKKKPEHRNVVAPLAAFHPPPNLPPERGEG